MNTDYLLTIMCTECNNVQYKYGLCHIHYDNIKSKKILENLYLLDKKKDYIYN
jgi:hypothetical protein